MEAITIHPKDKEQLSKVESALKALKVPFVKTKTESPYNPDFVAKIKRSEKAVKAGKTYKIPLDEIWK
ncbi:MAG TPA: DUF2683 family protein [Hanamia sp.]